MTTCYDAINARPITACDTRLTWHSVKSWSLMDFRESEFRESLRVAEKFGADAWHVFLYGA